MASRLREYLARLAGLFRPADGDRDVDEEMAEHLRLLAEEFVRRGMAAESAARAARAAFGNPVVARERHRDQRTLPAVESFVQDARYACRLLRRSPGFTAAAVLTLAVGIGLNTTFFTALNAVALRPLPVHDGDRLVRVERWLASEGRGDIQYAFSEPEFHYLAAGESGLADLVAAGWPGRVDDGSGERPRVQFVSANYFSALGVVPSVGGTFANGPSASEAGVVLSDAFWTRRYQRDPLIAGRTIALNGAAFSIAGVAPATFIGTANPPGVPDMWASMSSEGRMGVPRAPARRFQLLGHLRLATTRRAAEARINALARPLAATFRADDPTTALTLERATYFGETNDPRFQGFAAALMAAVALVLLIACANLANMLLARATLRRKEIGMRLALGASRARIVRQLLTESAVLALLGGASGLVVSVWASRLFWILIAEPVRLFAHGDVEPLVDLTPDVRLFLFTLTVSLLAAAAFGLLPALRASRPDLIATLKDEAAVLGRPMTGGAMRRWFAGGQVAVSMALLLAAGLLLRGLGASRETSTGYDTARVFDVTYVRAGDPATAARQQIQIAGALARTPGLSVALADRGPLAGTWTPPMTADGRSGRISARTLANRVSPAYFSTLGVPIVRGRAFRTDDGPASRAAIVSERAARLFWPDEDPLGRTFALDMDFRGTLRSFEVIGIARDVRTANLSRVDPSYVYLPLEATGHDHLLVRAALPPREGAAVIRAVVGAADVRLTPALQVTSLDDGPLRLQRATIGALAGFAATLAIVALALAMGGIYGVVAYLATSRRHEIGIRMALGARRADVLRLILADGLGPAAAGAVSGLGSAVILSALARASLSFPGTPDALFGVSAFDLVTFGGVTGLVTIVTFVAGAGPLWRAARVDPVVALRQT